MKGAVEKVAVEVKRRGETQEGGKGRGTERRGSQKCQSWILVKRENTMTHSRVLM